MIEQGLHLREIEQKEWLFFLFLFVFAVIAFTKTVFENRFSDFVNLLFSNKYLKIYKDSGQFTTSFNINFFLIQILSFSLFIQILLHNFSKTSLYDGILFIRITTAVVFFILAKFLIEKIIATAFGMEDFVDSFNLQKLTYRSYIGFLLLPALLVLYLNSNYSQSILIILLAIVGFLNVLFYVLTLKNIQKALLSKLFYFILYLCTLEIATYYFIYFWYKKVQA